MVKNISILKAMERRGFIKFCDQTGEYIYTLYSNIKHRCYYVDDGERDFIYNGKHYGIKYFDGCFNPFVVELPNNQNIIIGL